MKILAHISNLGIPIDTNSNQLLEYNEVFFETIKQVKQIQPTEIVITGIFKHHIQRFSPNSLNVVSDFVDELSKVAPVTIYPLDPRDRSVQKKFPVSPVSFYDATKSPYKIIYNEPYKSRITDSDLLGVNWALLAGSTYIRNPNSNVSDPGSLFQQNYTCSGKIHGFNVWQLTDDYLPLSAPTHIPVKSNWGYVTVKFKLNEQQTNLVCDMIPAKITDFPPNFRIKYLVEDSRISAHIIEEQHRMLLSCLPAHYNCIELKIVGIDMASEEASTPAPELPSLPILTDLGQEIEQLLPSELLPMHRHFLNQCNPPLDLVITNTPGSSNGMIIEKLEFENVLSYPNKPTQIDFTKMPGLVLISGLNASGKSNIFQIIKWTLYGLERGQRGAFNKHTKCRTISLQADVKFPGQPEKSYRIKRKIKFNEDDSLEHLEATLTDITDTFPQLVANGPGNLNKQLEKMVGDLKHFSTSCFYDNREKMALIDDTPKQSCQKLLDYCKLLQLEKLVKLANDLDKELAININAEERRVFQINQEIASCEHDQILPDQLEQLSQKVQEFQTSQQELKLHTEAKYLELISLHQRQQQQSMPNQEIANLARELSIQLPLTQPIPPTQAVKTLWSGGLLTVAHHTLETYYRLAIRHHIAPIAPSEHIAATPLAEITHMPIDNLNQLLNNDPNHLINRTVQLKRQREEALGPLTQLQYLLAQKRQQQLSITPEEINQVMDFCRLIEQNLTSQAYHENFWELKHTVGDAQHLEKIRFQLGQIRYQYEAKQHNEIQHKLHRFSELYQQYQQQQQQQQQLAEQLAQANQQYEHWQLKLKNADSNLKQASDHYQLQLIKFEFISKQLAEKQQQLDSLIKQLDQQRQQKSQVEQYKQLMSSDGIPTKILSKQLSTIERSINTILSLMSELKVNINLEEDVFDKSVVKMQIIKNHTQLEANRISGYETFIMRLAIKYALGIMGFVKTPRLFCIDEGLDCIDSENWPKVVELLQSLCGKLYETILIVNHNISSELSITPNRINVRLSGVFSNLTVSTK